MQEKNVSMVVDSDFMNIISKAHEESERLGVNLVSDILMVKNLIYYSESYLSDFFVFTGIKWSNIKNAIEKEVALWVKETKKNAAPKIDIESMNDENVEEFIKKASVFDEGVTVILACCPAFSFDGKFLDEIAFILAMLDGNESNYVKSFFKQLGMDTYLILRYYEGLMTEKATTEYYNSAAELSEDEIQNLVYNSEDQYEVEVNDSEETNGEFVIPPKLRSFVKIFEAEDTPVSPILGREKETEALTKVLLKSKKSNAILCGKAGVGKTAIIEHLAWLIKNEKCADGLKGKVILSLEVNDIIAGTTLRGMAEERFKLVSDFLANVENVILFIDEIHNVIGAGNSGAEDKLDFANALKPLLAREGVSVIGATTEAEYERIFAKDSAFKRRFEKISIREPKSEDVYNMVKEQIKKMSKFHGVTITRPVVEFIIKVSGCFLFETSNPDRTLDLIDKSMVNAKLNGKKVVTSDIVMQNFDANFDLYQKMSKEFKYATAYHEAGHFLLGRYGGNFQRKARAVSIIPANNYLGLTVYDDDDINLINWDYDALLNEIAMDLAGRVAERKYTGKNSSGACSDLENATELARKMVLQFGLSNTFSKRNSEKDFYDERVKNLNTEIDKIINEAYQLAEKVIKEHEELLKVLADALVKKGVLVQGDLERICKRFEAKKIEIKKPAHQKT